jgi:hypothetical protein
MMVLKTQKVHIKRDSLTRYEGFLWFQCIDGMFVCSGENCVGFYTGTMQTLLYALFSMVGIKYQALAQPNIPPLREPGTNPYVRSSF